MKHIIVAALAAGIAVTGAACGGSSGHHSANGGTSAPAGQSGAQTTQPAAITTTCEVGWFAPTGAAPFVTVGGASQYGGPNGLDSTPDVVRAVHVIFYDNQPATLKGAYVTVMYQGAVVAQESYSNVNQFMTSGQTYALSEAVNLPSGLSTQEWINAQCQATAAS